MEREDLKEVGKQILYIAAAIIIFAIIQPLINHKVDIITIIIALCAYIILTFIGAYLIRKGVEKDE